MLMILCRLLVAIRFTSIPNTMANTGVDFVLLSTRALNMKLFILLILVVSTCARKSSGGGSYGRYSHSSSGGSHSYPSSTGLSGSHSSNGHSYPHSGLSGNGVSNGGHSYPQPSGNGQYGNGHSYPQSTGLSGNNNIQKQPVNYNVPHHNQKTEIHHHYHYTPPQRVSYGSVSYPVYRHQPPVYVYQYRDSGSRYDTLLTGLALYNLGRMSSNHHHHYNEHRNYVSTPGEICKLGILRSNGDYEETRIDCRLISSFIWDSELQSNQATATPKNTVSTTVVNVTQVHNTTGNNSVTITVTNTTMVDALQDKGKSITVTPSMTCYVMRSSPTSKLRKEIKCGVLQAYAQSSFRNNCTRLLISHFLLPCLTMLIALFQSYFYS